MHHDESTDSADIPPIGTRTDEPGGWTVAVPLLLLALLALMLLHSCVRS
jgi:hypothetical protein